MNELCTGEDRLNLTDMFGANSAREHPMASETEVDGILMEHIARNEKRKAKLAKNQSKSMWFNAYTSLLS